MTSTGGSSDRAEHRREKVRALCRQLAAEVARIAPPGLGMRDEAWRIVADSSDQLFDLLSRWESTGDAALLDEIDRAYGEVVGAWKIAARSFRMESGAAV